MPRWTPCRDAVHLAPSILAADFGRLADEVRALEGSGAERIHVDVMDGVFVPNFTFGTDTVRVLRRGASPPPGLPLMIVAPPPPPGTLPPAGAPPPRGPRRGSARRARRGGHPGGRQGLTGGHGHCRTVEKASGSFR